MTGQFLDESEMRDLVNRDAHETLQSETETRSEIPGHETETRPRCFKIRPRRDETESLNSRDETETRPSVRRDHFSEPEQGGVDANAYSSWLRGGGTLTL